MREGACSPRLATTEATRLDDARVGVGSGVSVGSGIVGVGSGIVGVGVGVAVVGGGSGVGVGVADDGGGCGAGAGELRPGEDGGDRRAGVDPAGPGLVPGG